MRRAIASRRRAEQEPRPCLGSHYSRNLGGRPCSSAHRQDRRCRQRYRLRQSLRQPARLRHFGRAHLLHSDHSRHFPAPPETPRRRATLQSIRLPNRAGARYRRRVRHCHCAVHVSDDNDVARSHHRVDRCADLFSLAKIECGCAVRRPAHLAKPNDEQPKESERMANLFARKPLDKLMGEAQEVGEHSLKRSLGPMNLVALGIGGIIGAGLFVRTAAAIADRAGPSVVLAFIVAGIGCGFAGLCYAEFASMIPVAGSAYTYSYATMGEFVAWIIGWDLILEYAVAASTVSIAWSEYANRVLDWFGLRIPYQWTHSPFEHDPGGFHGMMNIPAVFILLLLTLLLIRGTKESAFVNGIIVVLKVSIVLLFIGIGWGFINPANHTPMIPVPTTYVTPQGINHAYGGILGILGAAGVVFFAYIGFDAVSTAAQEARNPKRD